MPEKKDEKKPLDMTTDEAIDFLFGQEGAKTLRKAVQDMNGPPPGGDDEGPKRSSKSARKHGNT